MSTSLRSSPSSFFDSLGEVGFFCCDVFAVIVSFSFHLRI
jgi:hypothetical protein